MADRVEVTALEVAAYTVPTDFPEADGTLHWDKTTILVVHLEGGGRRGVGYANANAAAAKIVRGVLEGRVVGADAMDIAGVWQGMCVAARNVGRPGLCASAISAVDNALWDLKAKLLDLPLAKLLGQAHERIDIYGRGGFTSYAHARLASKLGGWVESGIGRVKMKVGEHPKEDPDRVRLARDAIGSGAELFVDANGAYDRKQALTLAERFARHDVTWFEEPVTSDDLEGLRLLRDRAPAAMAIAAGEYGYTPTYFRRMLEAGAVDVLQADGTRCLGVSGFLQAAALCEAFHVPLSSHTAPALHVHLGCATRPFRHLEWFHDHVRIEEMLFDGAPRPVQGTLGPDLSRPGFGIELRTADAQRFAA
jgi:L-alanine-DL-glutamate epimerase-like enolase superfamily enzyme